MHVNMFTIRVKIQYVCSLKLTVSMHNNILLLIHKCILIFVGLWLNHCLVGRGMFYNVDGVLEVVFCVI